MNPEIHSILVLRVAIARSYSLSLAPATVQLISFEEAQQLMSVTNLMINKTKFMLHDWTVAQLYGNLSYNTL